MRDFLQNFPTEKVDIYDKDGNKITEVNGLFGTTSLTITDTSIPLLEASDNAVIISLSIIK